jgi:hypothetical protein
MLAMRAQGSNPGGRFQVYYCPSNGSASISGLKLSFQFWAVSDSSSPDPTDGMMYVYTESTWVIGGPAANINYGGIANTVSGLEVDSGGAQGTYFGVVLSLPYNWSGWFYFDNFDLR